MEHTPTIMIVDDSATTLEVFQYFLGGNGYTILPAASGEYALTLIANGVHPDLILLDVQMPGMDGLEVCRQLKANDTTQDIPVIFISTSVDSVKGFEAGGVDYVPKSAEHAEILARVNAHLTIRKQQQQLEAQNHQLRVMQEQLIVQEKLASLGELTAGISHELKNPLNFVVNFSQLILGLAQDLQAELAKPAPDQSELAYILKALPDFAEKIHTHGSRAVRIIQGMLQHSRGEKGTRVPTYLNLLVKEYVALAFHSLRAQDDHFNAEIRTQYEPALDTQEIMIVPHDVSQVILNISQNAFQALRAKAPGNGFQPMLLVSTCDQGDTIRIRLRDNGPGIPEAIREKIFQPFFTTKPAGEGTGLGLSIAYDIIVKEHQGQLTVDSKEGAFTEFTIVLPKGG